MRTSRLQHYLKSRITERCLREHQVRHVSDKEARNNFGIRWKKDADLSGTLFPIFGIDGEIKGYRVRRDNPEIEDGKPKNKYIQSADPSHLYFERTSSQYLSDVSVPIIFVEAYSSALALACWSDRLDEKYLIV